MAAASSNPYDGAIPSSRVDRAVREHLMRPKWIQWKERLLLFLLAESRASWAARLGSNGRLSNRFLIKIACPIIAVRTQIVMLLRHEIYNLPVQCCTPTWSIISSTLWPIVMGKLSSKIGVEKMMRLERLRSETVAGWVGSSSCSRTNLGFLELLHHHHHLLLLITWVVWLTHITIQGRLQLSRPSWLMLIWTVSIHPRLMMWRLLPDCSPSCRCLRTWQNSRASLARWREWRVWYLSLLLWIWAVIRLLWGRRRDHVM
jgi:hypothetical protein